MARFRPQLNSPYLWLLAILTVGALVRVWGIERYGLWLNEAYSALYAQLPLETLVELRRQGTNPPLYHLLLRAWVAAFGAGESALRMMSVVAGVAAVALAYPLGCRFGDRRTGLITCAILALSNWAIYYSQEARFYALTEAMAILTSLLLYDALAKRRPVPLVGYVLAASAFVWMHTCAWFVLLAQAIWVGLRLQAMPARERLRAGLWFGLAGGLVILSFLPWVPVLLDQISTVSKGYWVPPPRWIDLADWAQGMIAPWAPWRWPIVIVCAGVFVVAVARQRTQTVQSASPPAVDRLDRIYLLLWVFLPMVVPVIWSLIGTPIFRPRYALVSQPAALVLLAGLIIRRPAVCSALLAAFVLILPRSIDCPLVREDWRGAARLIETQAGPDARVFVFRGFCYFPLRYYLDPSRAITPVFHPEQPRTAFGRQYPPGVARTSGLLEAVSGPGEFWVVLSHLDLRVDDVDHEALVQQLCGNGRPCQRLPLERVEVLRIAPPAVEADEVHHDRE
ncbi:MAG: glycosyltransferase family 39 protein [Phycisphaerales bacterium]|nr:MAG: glycosyltransferase family 39 protein [Phycisphaerales bacterium]